MRAMPAKFLFQKPWKTRFIIFHRQFSQQLDFSAKDIRPMPSCKLRMQRKDGSVVAAKEEDIYRSNDDLETSKRYRKFNIRELLDVAVQSSYSGARRCTSVMKYREGQYNKTFLFTFDDGSEAVAKLPNPNAGPRTFTTASEVATMDYAREILGLPIPRVLSWNCDSSNAVKSEYIIMEKAKGTPLGDAWYQLPSSSKHKILNQMVEMEEKLAAAPFPEHGCIYYTQDLPMDYRNKDQGPLPGDNLKKFRIGPVVDPALWSGERAKMRLSRGPCKYQTFQSSTGVSSLIIHSMGSNERAWAMQYAQPRMNYYRSNADREVPAEYRDLIEKYLLVVPHLTQSRAGTMDLVQPTLWHSDLHLNNAYVDLSTDTITDIIDWQGATVAPLILQAKVPRMVHHTSPLPLGWVMLEKPEDYETLSERDKSRADKLYESALCHKYYEVCTAKGNPRHYAAISHNYTWKTPLIHPTRSESGAWSSREVIRLRSSLMTLVAHWQELESGVDCPIRFTEEEKKMHHEEMENRDYVEQMMEEFQEAGILPIDGTVDPEDYEIVRKTNRTQKENLMSLAENEEQKAWMDKIWPYQDLPEGT